MCVCVRANSHAPAPFQARPLYQHHQRQQAQQTHTHTHSHAQRSKTGTLFNKPFQTLSAAVRNTGNCKCLRQTAPKQVHCLSSRPNLTCCGRITGNCKCLRHARVAPENRHRARSKQGLFSIFCLRPHPFFHELHAVEVAAHRATHGECSVRMGSHVLWGFLQGIFVCIYMYVFTIVFCSVCACVCVCVHVCVCM